MKTLTQQVILAEIRKTGLITPDRVMQITGCVYRDRPDYVWQTLGRMVKAGMIKYNDYYLQVGMDGMHHRPTMSRFYVVNPDQLELF